MMEHKKSKRAKQVKKYCTYLAYPRTVLDFTRVFMSTKTFKTASREGYIRRASFSKHKKKVVYTGTKTSNPKTKTKPRTQK